MLAVSKGWEWQRWCWIFERLDEVVGCCCCFVQRGCCWHLDAGGEPFHGVRYAETLSFGDPNLVASVVVFGGADIPGVHGVRCPRFAVFGFDVYEDLGARWAHGGGIEIEIAMDLGVRQEFGVESGVAE